MSQETNRNNDYGKRTPPNPSQAIGSKRSNRALEISSIPRDKSGQIKDRKNWQGSTSKRERLKRVHRLDRGRVTMRAPIKALVNTPKKGVS